jgi:predicted MFS family arabinose efflux permease
MILASNPGSFTMITTPLLLTAFIQGGDLTAAQATTLGAGELGGMSAASLVAAMLVGQFDRRMLVAAGLVLALVGHVLSISVHDYMPILLARVLAGFGVGTMFTVAVASLAGLANPDRAFGFSMTTNQVATLVLMGVLAGVGTGRGAAPIVLTIAVASALMGLAIPFIPGRPPANAAQAALSPAGKSMTLAPAVLALCGTLTFSLGIGAVWPLVGQIGRARGVAGEVVDATIAMAGFAAIAGGLVAAAIGARFGRIPVLALCMICLAAAMLLMRAGLPAGDFQLLVLAMMFFWPLSIPFYLGTLAALDPNGRLAALSGAMLPGGMALGQSLAAGLVSNGDFGQVVTIGAPAMLIALVLMAAACWRARRP